MRELLRWHADTRRQAGYAALRQARLHRGLRLLVHALELAEVDDDARAVIGLAALATGDPQLARAAWSGCGEEHDAWRWLAALEESDGPIRHALTAYNLALAAATSERLDEALPLVRQACEGVPGFVPAYRLHGLILAARGQLIEARKVWLEGLDACEDDELLLRYLAHTSSTPASVPSAPHAGAEFAARRVPDNRRAPAARWLGLAAAWLLTIIGTLALAGVLRPERWSHDDAVDDLALPPAGLPSGSAQGPPAGSPPESTGTSGHPITPVPTAPPTPTAAPPLSLAGYRLGRLAAREREWHAVIYHLESAGTTNPELYYVDDALYLLARAYGELGAPEAARAVARQLLAEHPTSIFANSITHELARDGTE